MYAEIRDIDIDGIRNISRVAANLDLADDLLENPLLLANSDRLAGKMKWNGDFDLLTLDQPLKVGMDQTQSHRINLTIAKHHFTWANPLDVERKNCVSSRFRP